MPSNATGEVNATTPHHQNKKALHHEANSFAMSLGLCAKTPDARFHARDQPQHEKVTMNTSIRRFLFYWAPPALWAAGIFSLSCISLPPKPPLFPGVDKVAHVVLYSGLALLLFRALRRDRGFSPWRAATWAFVFAALYGITDEFHQNFTPNRSVELLDWVADAVGGATAFALALMTRRPAD